MDPGLRLLASRWFFVPFALLAVAGTAGLIYVLITGVHLTTSNLLRGGIMLLLSYMALALSMEARRVV